MKELQGPRFKPLWRDFVKYACHRLVSISLAKSEGKHCDETFMLKKVHSPWKMSELPSPQY